MPQLTNDEADLAAVITLLAEYARRIDCRDGAGWSDLFDQDGALTLATRDIVGREALAQFAFASPVGVHVQGLPTITSREGDSIECVSSWVFINVNGQILAGGYVDTLRRRDDDQLLFSVRRVQQRAAVPVPS